MGVAACSRVFAAVAVHRDGDMKPSGAGLARFLGETTANATWKRRVEMAWVAL